MPLSRHCVATLIQKLDYFELKLPPHQSLPISSLRFFAPQRVRLILKPLRRSAGRQFDVVFDDLGGA